MSVEKQEVNHIWEKLREEMTNQLNYKKKV